METRNQLHDDDQSYKRKTGPIFFPAEPQTIGANSAPTIRLLAAVAVAVAAAPANGEWKME